MLIPFRPSLTEDSVESPSRSRFTFAPLEPGFGYTLGNSLRRTLLSSIPGAAVTSVKIDGVLHEFSTVPGCREDVSEIILNIKGIVLSSYSEDDVVYMTLTKQGPGKVTAGDIAVPADVEIHNPDLVLAELNDSGVLNMEFTVERGRGYVPATMADIPEEIGRIPVDQIYTPVLKVSYKVEATRVGRRTDFDKLILDVETKGSISARDAVASAGKTLAELFGLARELNINADGIEVGERPEGEHSEVFAMPVAEVGFSKRCLNCLARQQIHTVGDLASKNEADLMDIRNFGQKSIDEVKIKLHELGVRLKDTPEDFDPSTIPGYDAQTGGFINDDDDSE